MLKKTLSAVVIASAVLGAVSVSNAAFANETNPLHPSYQTFAAKIDFGTNQSAVEIGKNPLQPSFYQWNVATSNDGSTVQIVMNNPLQPGYKRS